MGGRGAGGGEVEDGAGDAVLDGDVAGSGVGHGTDDGEGMRAGVALVEFFDGVLVGGASAGGATEDDGGALGCVVAGEGALLDGLAGGEDGDQGAALGVGDDAGIDVGDGVEVADLGHHAEA